MLCAFEEEGRKERSPWKSESIYIQDHTTLSHHFEVSSSEHGEVSVRSYVGMVFGPFCPKCGDS